VSFRVGDEIGLQRRKALVQSRGDDASWIWVSGNERPVWGEVRNASLSSVGRVLICVDSQHLHQQKSTFLIPSYSILLHLIPLILRVRRE